MKCYYLGKRSGVVAYKKIFLYKMCLYEGKCDSKIPLIFRDPFCIKSQKEVKKLK